MTYISYVDFSILVPIAIEGLFLQYILLAACSIAINQSILNKYYHGMSQLTRLQIPKEVYISIMCVLFLFRKSVYDIIHSHAPLDISFVMFNFVFRSLAMWIIIYL